MLSLLRTLCIEGLLFAKVIFFIHVYCVVHFFYVIAFDFCHVCEREREGGREGEGERENGGGGRVRLKVGSETLRDRVAPIICYFYFTIKICT